MGFSFRRKGNDQEVNDASEVQVVGVSSSNDAHDIAANAELHLKRLKEQHKFDPFMDDEKVDAIDAALETGNAEKEYVVEESILGENSPYAEVRAAVSRVLPRGILARPTSNPRSDHDCRFPTLMTWIFLWTPSEPGPLVSSHVPSSLP